MTMTKIETFKAKKAVADRVARAVHLSLGRDGPRNDKAHFSATFVKLLNVQWIPMQINVEMSHGYYGNSSGYSDTSDEMGRYLAAAITKHKTLLLDTAAEMASADADAARKDAEDEAREVLMESQKA